LDSTLFGTQADDGVRPAGLLNGVSALTSTAGGGLNALIGDIKALTGALVAAGAGRDPVIVTNPVQAATLRLLTNTNFNIPVLSSNAVAVGTVIMLEGSSFVSAFDPTPRFEAGDQMAIHMEDVAPVDITGGTPSPAVPVRSMFQVDSIGLRMTLNAAWGLRTASVSGQHNISYVTAVTW
jgi:hypothetical protein